jgi:hypothetical protein
MRLIIVAAFVLVAGCATVKSPNDEHAGQTPGTACWTRPEQLAQDNARLTQLLLDVQRELQRRLEAQDPKTQPVGQTDVGSQKKIQCVLAEMRALQQCEIWYRSERALTLFDQKMQQCVQRRSYFETPGDCSRRPQ